MNVLLRSLFVVSLALLSAACGGGGGGGDSGTTVGSDTGGTSGTGGAGTGTGDTTAPATPGEVATAAAATDSLGLTWAPSTASDVAAYEVYRGTTLVATRPTPDFTDSGLAAGTQYCYSVVAIDSAGNRSTASDSFCATTLSVPLVVTTASLDTATAGAPYSATLAASGEGPYSWSAMTIAPGGATSSNGLNLDASTGVISGTPTYAGTQPVHMVLDGARGSVGIEYDLSIGGSGSAYQITNSPTAATQGGNYSFTFETSWTSTLGCDPLLTLAYGSIPPGLSLNLINGTLSGAPTMAGRYTMTLYGDSTGNCSAAPTNLKTVTMVISPNSSPTTPAGSSNWTRQGSNAALSPSASGWDGFVIGAPSVVKVATTYYMLYEGVDSSSYRYAIGLATSSDGATWTKYGSNPVIRAGTAWDAGGVRYPVVYHDGSQFWLWYQGTGSSGTAIGLATSSDGIDWTPHAANPVITESGLISAYAPGAVVVDNGQWQLYMSADGSVHRAVSGDGINWSASDNVFSSSDNAVRIGRPAVLFDGAKYRMWYTRIEIVGTGLANDSGVYPITIGYADSDDGITWDIYGNPIFTAGAEGAWDRPGVGVPSVIKDSTAFRMWYVGGRGHLPGDLYEANAFVEGAIGYAKAQ